MASETIGEYEIEYTGVPGATGKGWVAYLTIYGPSSNPMHRNEIFPRQHVSVETIYLTVEAAEEEAHRVGLTLVKR